MILQAAPHSSLDATTHEDVSNGGKDVVVGEPWGDGAMDRKVSSRRELQQKKSSEKSGGIIYLL